MGITMDLMGRNLMDTLGIPKRNTLPLDERMELEERSRRVWFRVNLNIDLARKEVETTTPKIFNPNNQEAA